MPLRIFEPRYLTMIGECMKNGSPFGVVLATPGADSSQKGGFHTVGTLAQIEDFDQLEDGFLGVTSRGTSRFSVQDFYLQDDQLIVAEVEILNIEEQEEAQAAEVAKMTTFLRKLSEQEDLKDWAETLRPDWSNQHWISCRLSELLPLSTDSRQALLEMSSGKRLTKLSKVMQENNMI